MLNFVRFQKLNQIIISSSYKTKQPIKMNLIIIAALLAENKASRTEKVKRRTLRDRSNPLDLPNSAFIAQYRVNKAAFNYILQKVEADIQPSSISPAFQLAATLRFLAEGGQQLSFGKNGTFRLGRNAETKILLRMLNSLHSRVCDVWIKLNVNEEQRNKTKKYFFENCGIPGVVGCIDGTHIRIVKPAEKEYIFSNRKGFYSLNAMIICDHNRQILAVNARHPGSCLDAFIFSLSDARHLFLTKYEAGDRNSWLLGDAGYRIEPFLLVPYKNPEPGSEQHKFNNAHASARNLIERTIAELKGRFRCLLDTLQFQPQRVVQMVNVCCALHNICRHYKVENDFGPKAKKVDFTASFIGNTSASSLKIKGTNIRDELAGALKF